MPPSFLHRRFIRLTALFTLASFTLMAFFTFESQQPVSAVQLPPKALNTGPNIHASTILTDSFENNDTKETAVGITSADCSVNGSSITGLDLFKASGGDVDFFKFQGDGQFYKISVSPQSPGAGELKFNVQVISGTASTAFQAGDNANQSNVSIQFQSANNVVYYIRIAPSNANDVVNKNYSINLCNSSTAQTGPTATPIPVLGQPGGAPDGLEGNDTPSEANNKSYIAVGQTIQNLNFYPRPPKNTAAILGDGDVDWIFFYAKANHIYRFTTKVSAGIDTQILLFDFADDIPASLNNEPYTIDRLIAENDDYESLNRGSQLTFTASRDGKFWVKIWNRDPSPKTQANMTYELSLIEVLPATATPVLTPTPTLTPSPVPTLVGVGQPDKYEPNNDFAKASLIAPGQEIKGLSFVPYQPANINTTDYDYFRLPVKTGLYYSCETYELAPGVDTNLIIYDQRGGTLGTNDDISNDERNKGNFASKFTWYANYEGYVYVMVSELRPPRADEVSSHTYSLKCTIGPPPTQVGPAAPPAASGPDAAPSQQATPKPATSGPEKPEAPAPAPTPIRTPQPTDEPIKPIQPLTVRPVQRQAPVATPRPITPARTIAIDIAVFNDANRNGTSDASEQIRGISVWVVDERTGAPLAQNETDDSGNVRISVNSDGPVRINVPLFGYSQLVNETNASLRIGMINDLVLPKVLP